MSDHPGGFTPHTLDHLTRLILGTPRSEYWEGPPHYRSGTEIGRWMRHFVTKFAMGSLGRYRETRDELERLNESAEGRGVLLAMMAAVLHAPDYAQWSALLDDDIATFNNHLWYDGYRLVREPRSIRIEKIVEPHVLAPHLEDALVGLEWAIVSQDFQRMVDNTERDPEDAITAACALVESVCRSILVELEEELPSDRSITTLYKHVAKKLGISADRDDLPSEVVGESKRILGGLANTVAGTGRFAPGPATPMVVSTPCAEWIPGLPGWR